MKKKKKEKEYNNIINDEEKNEKNEEENIFGNKNENIKKLNDYDTKYLEMLDEI